MKERMSFSEIKLRKNKRNVGIIHISLCGRSLLSVCEECAFYFLRLKVNTLNLSHDFFFLTLSTHSVSCILRSKANVCSNEYETCGPCAELAIKIQCQSQPYQNIVFSHPIFALQHWNEKLFEFLKTVF